MVGNDVVDLAEPGCAPGARHPRFDERVFAPVERRCLHGAGPAEARRRWSLWAAKESAFKAARRRDPAVPFAPARFAVELDAAGRGWVVHGARAFRVCVAVRGGLVHAIATDPALDPDAVVAGVARIPVAAIGDPTGRAAGRAVRRAAAGAVARHLGLPADALAVRRSGRMPRLVRRRDGAATGLLSLSHHGRFVAWAWVAYGAGPL